MVVPGESWHLLRKDGLEVLDGKAVYIKECTRFTGLQDWFSRMIFVYLFT